MILSEDDVRAYVREASGGKARWVEPALGSTPGLPDCWVPLAGDDRTDRFGQIDLELKCGVMTRNNEVKYTVRPEQRREILRMKEDGLCVGLLVGIKGTKNLLFLKPTPKAIFGSFSMLVDAEDRFETTIDNKLGFWSGVNFIFLKSH